jgi:hypothetical protein
MGVRAWTIAAALLAFGFGGEGNEEPEPAWQGTGVAHEQPFGDYTSSELVASRFREALRDVY